MTSECPAGPGRPLAGGLAAVRRRRRRGADRLREDNDALRLHADAQHPDRQLTTIEDPIEYRTEGLDQIEVNARAGLNFANGLRTILRSDPDVILIGEVRDEETAQIAFRAAMTGHLVLTTLHAQTAASAIQRLRDMNIEPSILATSINCIVGQRLVRRVCRECSRPTEPSDELLESLLIASIRSESEFVEARGCAACGDTGYSGALPSSRS